MDLNTGSGSGSAGEKASEMREGFIVTLKLKNFLVYKDVKVRFGPRLNMVVGPNGSGKSTLVCAIALGLGGSPKVLGRADNLSSFVMHGVKDDASVTVELYMPNGPNLFITRTFSRKSNKSNWHMNGRPISEKAVKEKVLALRIQVDNLCTMLPQDKVGDFSGFTPDKLLLETEKALSHDSLYQPHLKLIEMQDDKGKSQNELETKRLTLEGMETELAGLEKDKQRFEERQEKQNQLALFEKRKVWLEAERLRNEGLEAKADEKAAVTELNKAKAADAPLNDEYRKWFTEDARLKVVVKNREAQKTKAEKDATDTKGQIEKLTSEVMFTAANIENLETVRKNKETKLARDKTKLEKLCDDLDRAREKAAQQKKPGEINDLHHGKMGELQGVKADLQGQRKIIEARRLDIRSEDAKIKGLTNKAAMREKNFRRRFRQDGEVALKVRDWAARNAGKLKGPVVGPIGLEVTVEDSDAAQAVEFHIPSHVWCALVVNCKEDHDTIIREFRGERSSLGILVNQGGTLRPISPMFSKAEMDALKKDGGVRGFLDDFISCKDTVKQVLRRNQKVHNVFMGSYATGKKILQDQTFLARLGKKGPNGVQGRSTIFAGGSHGAPGGGGRNGANVEPLQVYDTKISLYGNKKPSVRVQEVRGASMIGAGLDNVAIDEAQRKKTAFEAQLAAALDKEKKINVKHNALEEQLNQLKIELSNISRVVQFAKTIEGKVSTLEKNVAAQETALASGGEEEKADLTKRLERGLEHLAKSVAAAQHHAGSVLDKSMELMAAQLARRVASDKLEDAKDALAAAEEGRVALQQKVNELKHTTAQLVKEFKAVKDKANRTAPKIDDNGELTEFGRKYEELPDNHNELDAMIDDIREDLNDSVHNPQVIRRYEKHKAETEQVRKEVKDLEDWNANAMELMEKVRLPWKTRLEETVARLNGLFAKYMSDMDGCEGVVKLAEDSSYKKWGIEIKVRFRSEADQGKLTVLNKHVHSGGERSVSTILYLMALQDLQSSPFRVVDEINQGMDPKNERQVFSRIVSNSCGAHRKSQYFLITPKLLQGLVAMDNADMTVIFIMNGPNCFTGTDDHVMRNFIAAKKRQLALEAGDAQGGGQRRRIV